MIKVAPVCSKNWTIELGGRVGRAGVFLMRGELQFSVNVNELLNKK